MVNILSQSIEMKFWENFEITCTRNKIKPNQLAKVLNISSGTITAWKKGTPPNSERLEAIADYFGVSTDYLLGRSSADPALLEDEQRLLNNYRKASAERKQIIQDIAEGAGEPEQRKNIESA